MIRKNHQIIKNKIGNSLGRMQEGNNPRPKENTLVIIRHGSTQLNDESDERIRGWIDVPLSDEGVKEINDTMPAIKKAKIDGLISSDLQRTKQTAEIISKATGIPILGESSALRPWHLGVMSGKRVKVMLPAMMSYIKNPDEVVPSGESFNQFKERFIRFIQQVQTKYPKDKIAIVTHHRGERLVSGWMKAGKPDSVLKIDPDVFNFKGTPPGGMKDFEIPPPDDKEEDRYPQIT